MNRENLSREFRDWSLQTIHAESCKRLLEGPDMANVRNLSSPVVAANVPDQEDLVPEVSSLVVAADILNLEDNVVAPGVAYNDQIDGGDPNPPHTISDRLKITEATGRCMSVKKPEHSAKRRRDPTNMANILNILNREDGEYSDDPEGSPPAKRPCRRGIIEQQ
jgi:hypothetical protein